MINDPPPSRDIVPDRDPLEDIDITWMWTNTLTGDDYSESISNLPSININSRAYSDGFHIVDEDQTAPQAITWTLADALAAGDYSESISNLPSTNIDSQAYSDGFGMVRPWFSILNCSPFMAFGDLRL